MRLVSSGGCARDALTANLACISPFAELSRLDDHACKQLTECVQQVSLGLCFFNSVSVLREGCLEAMVHSLRQMVVKSVEKLFFCHSADASILYKRVADIIGSHTIEQKLVMSLVLRFVFLTLEVGANEVPESVADKGIEVLHIDNVDELVLHMRLTITQFHA